MKKTGALRLTVSVDASQALAAIASAQARLRAYCADLAELQEQIGADANWLPDLWWRR